MFLWFCWGVYCHLGLAWGDVQVEWRRNILRVFSLMLYSMVLKLVPIDVVKLHILEGIFELEGLRNPGWSLENVLILFAAERGLLGEVGAVPGPPGWLLRKLEVGGLEHVLHIALFIGGEVEALALVARPLLLGVLFQ